MFRAHSEWLAQLEITDSSEDAFTMRSADRLHQLGFFNAPLYYVLEAPSTDDAYQVGFVDHGRWIAQQTEPGDDALARWLPSAHWSAGCALAAHLPQGVYWWVRSRVEPYPTDTVLMGNEYVEREPHIMELLQNPDYYAAIVSREKGGPPVLDQPLLGVPVLNSDGTERSGILFFPCVDGDGVPREERLLIIPERGVFVLDAQRRFSEEDHRAALDRWASSGARGLADLLAV